MERIQSCQELLSPGTLAYKFYKELFQNFKVIPFPNNVFQSKRQAVSSFYEMGITLGLKPDKDSERGR